VPGSHRQTRRPRRGVLVDGLVVLAVAVFAAFLSGSRTWVGFTSPDSEFYASMALFGHEVTDRSVDPAYTWTRLGYIAPVRGLVTTLGPWLGFAAWRFLLILLIAGSLYAVTRMCSTRQLATMVATVGVLNTMVLAFVGNTYLTGTILAATMVLLTLGAWGSLAGTRRAWLPPLLSGLVSAWLLMLNPYAFLLGMAMWLALRCVPLVLDPAARWRALWRDAGAGLLGFGLGFGALVAAGEVLFPGRNWLGTYLAWNSQLDYASFVGDPDVWRHDIALLVPALAVLLTGIALLLTRAGDHARRWAAGGLVVAVASVVFTWGFVALVPGPWLEAPTYVAKLWSGALVALALAFGSVVGRRDLGWPGWAAGAVAVPLILWAGRWDRDVSAPAGLLIAGLVVLLFLLAVIVLRGGAGALASVLVVVSLGSLALGAQVLQNGRGLLGIYGQYPLRAAYVDFDIDLLMHSKVAAEEFVLAQTTRGDRIGIWTDPERLTSGIAAMQFWGKYNNVGSGAVLAPAEAEQLARMRPTAIAMYAPSREQVYAFWASLPAATRPTAPACTAVPFLGIGSPDAQVCVTHLSWDS
jgi:hypothetical protein